MQKHQIEKFIQIYEKEYGIKLSHSDAMVLAKNIVELIRLTYKPIKKTSLHDEKTV